MILIKKRKRIEQMRISKGFFGLIKTTTKSNISNRDSSLFRERLNINNRQMSLLIGLTRTFRGFSYLHSSPVPVYSHLLVQNTSFPPFHAFPAISTWIKKKRWKDIFILSSWIKSNYILFSMSSHILTRVGKTRAQRDNETDRLGIKKHRRGLWG